MIDATIEFRKLPKIDELLSDARLDALITDYGREQIVAAVRAEVDLARTRIG